MAHSPGLQLAVALVDRGVVKGRLGDIQGELADYTAVVTPEGAPKEQVAQALFNRGLTRRMMGDHQSALADFKAVLALEGAPKARVARALFNRGLTRGMLGDTQGALTDYTAVTMLEDADKEQVARALFNRGSINPTLGRKANAIADWTAFLELGGSFEAASAWQLRVYSVYIGRMELRRRRTTSWTVLRSTSGPNLQTRGLWHSRSSSRASPHPRCGRAGFTPPIDCSEHNHPRPDCRWDFLSRCARFWKGARKACLILCLPSSASSR